MYKKTAISIFAGLVLLLTSTDSVFAVTLQRVKDPSHVCMVNNEVMGKPQIPIKVADKTYYGCCKMCVGKLTNNKSARMAVDPVSGKEVDKSTATIGAKPNGEVLYFESEKTFEAFNK